MAQSKKRKPKYCDRCRKLITKKVFYRYPHVFDKITGSCKDAIFSVLLQFDEKCCKIFDKNNDDMRMKYHMHNNKKLIAFYKQYVHTGRREEENE